MRKSSKYYSEWLWVAGILLGTWGMTSPGFAQSPSAGATGLNQTLVEEVRLDKGHPEFTRVIIQLNRRTPYRIVPDLANKRMMPLFFPYVT